MALTKLKTGAIADDAVTTDKLANAINTERTANTAKVSLEDNAVTLAKMAGGTDGQIITYDASGDPVAVGPGTDGQVLTSTGAGSPPAFESIPASGISDVVSDTSPQLGGDLYSNDKSIRIADSTDAAENRLKIGSDSDIEIYHNGSDSYFKNSVGNLNIATNGELGIYGGADYGEVMAKFVNDGAVELYHDNSKKLTTTSTGVKQLGGFQVLNSAESEWIAYGNADGECSLYYDGSQKIETTSYGTKVHGYQSSTSSVGFHVEGTLDNKGFGTNHGHSLTTYDVAYFSPIPMWSARSIEYGSSYLTFSSYASGEYIKFTAPVNGLYQFELVAAVELHDSDDWMVFGWEKNNTSESSNGSFASNGQAVCGLFKRQSGDDIGGSHFITTIFLDANDYVVLYQQSASTCRWAGNEYWCRGHLIN